MLTLMLAACGVEDEHERERVRQLFYTYGRRVKALAQSILHNEQDAEDALHDTFLKIIQYREKFFRLDGDETARLIVIYTRSVCFNLYRRRQRERGIFVPDTEDADTERQADEIDLLERVLARESAERLRDAIDALPSPAREIVLLKYYGESSNTEIAELLGMPASTVGTVLWRSLKKIKERTEAYFRDTN